MLCFSYLREVFQGHPSLRDFVVGVVRFVFIMPMYLSRGESLRHGAGLLICLVAFVSQASIFLCRVLVCCQGFHCQVGFLHTETRRRLFCGM